MAGYFERRNESSGFKGGLEFCDQLGDCSQV
jgi:hypothetical protein